MSSHRDVAALCFIKGCSEARGEGSPLSRQDLLRAVAVPCLAYRRWVTVVQDCRRWKEVQVLVRVHSPPQPHLVIVSVFEHSNLFSRVLDIYSPNLGSLYCVAVVWL